MNGEFISLNTAKKIALYDKNLKKKLEYKKRIDKAIEYIKTKEVDFVDVHYQQQDDYFNDLLSILQGDKNE